MKQKHMTIVAVGCGVACALCVAAYLASVQGQVDAERAEALARYGGEQVEVCVATRDIAAGERIDLSAVETKLWVADLLPDGALQSSADAVGKVATTSILKGEVISEKRFESSRGTIDVPPGKEAVSVPARAVQAVGGAVRPGMSVDVYSAGDTSTVAIARGVVVLDMSVGDGGSLVSSDTGWITLAVDPETVQEIIAASSKTTLYFVIPGEDVAGGISAGEDPETDEDAGDSGVAGVAVAGEVGKAAENAGETAAEGAAETTAAEVAEALADESGEAPGNAEANGSGE